jgi:acyl-CoA synthetase (AMP-forming)/AMP-acid ligase II
VKRRGATIGERDLRDFALRHGPAYAHPRRVLFIDALPLNGAAKTDRIAVKALVRSVIGDVPLASEER